MNKDYSLKQFLGRPLIGILVGGFPFSKSNSNPFSISK